MAEARFIQPIMSRDLKGTPTSNPASYSEQTPFEMRLKAPGNERFLRNIPVRVYHDLDVAWQLNNRRRGLIDSNAMASSEMIARLLMQGNTRAEFVRGRAGFRSNGMRHTHSWSIIDEVELIQWMKESIKG